MSKKYRKKTKDVEALKTYHGQPMVELRDFLLERIFISAYSFGSFFTDPIEGDFTVNPGDYILKDECGKVSVCSALVFEDEYEPVVNPGEINAVVRAYGFTIEQAHTMLSHPETRSVLLASLEQEKATHVSKAVLKVNFESLGTDVDKVVKKIEERFQKEILNGSH